MSSDEVNGGIVLRDGAGAWYLLTPEILKQARSSAERHGSLLRHVDRSTEQRDSHRRAVDDQPLQVMGVVVLPASESGRENPFWPGIFE